MIKMEDPTQKDLTPSGYVDFMKSINLEIAERSDRTDEEKRKAWKMELILGYKVEGDKDVQKKRS